METVKVLFIDDIEGSYEHFRLIEDVDLSSREIDFKIVNRQNHFKINNMDQLENIEKEIEWAIENGLDILILDIFITLDDHDENKQLPNDIATFSSILLEEKYHDRVNLILFTSSSQVFEAVSDFETMRKNNPELFKERWKFIPKVKIDYPDIPHLMEPCPRLCGDKSRYDPSPPCTSIECIYWQLVKQYKNT